MRKRRFWPLIRVGPPLILALTGGIGAGAVPLVEDAVVRLRVQPLLVMEGQSGALAPSRVEIEPETGGRLELDLQWPDPTASSRLKLVARGRAGTESHKLALEVELRLPGGERVRAEREMTLREGATGLFEVHRRGSGRLTLALTAERYVRGFVPARPSAGEPVAFSLEVERVLGERRVLLETNRLHTFMGERVEYAFRRGGEEDGESVQLLMTPLRRAGDVVELRVEISGRLPTGSEPVLLGRTQTLFTSRGATSDVEVLAGEPPSGYRFRITPRF